MASSREHFSDAGTEVEKYLAQWKAERDAIRSEREAEEKRDEYEFQKAKQDIEAEFHQQRQMMAASGAQSLNLMDSYLADRRLNKLKVLQQEYDQRRDKRHAFYNKRELDHSESYSVQLSSRLRSIPLRTAVSTASWLLADGVLVVLTVLDHAAHKLIAESYAAFSRSTVSHA
jgi:uncharacterized membrane protein YgaE (UPF0421/DUF939 family)